MTQGERLQALETFCRLAGHRPGCGLRTAHELSRTYPSQMGGAVVCTPIVGDLPCNCGYEALEL